jgi:Bacterial protein of unknown function (DUF922)
MQLLKLYFTLLVSLPLFSFAQDKDEELINWSNSRQLTWNDYKGKPDTNSGAAASTTTYLGIEYNIDEKGLTYKIECRFSKTKSWGISKTEPVLKHEQGHFDIAEIFARMLNKRMHEYKFDRASYKKDLKAIYQGITAEKEVFQDLYDSETDHSRKKQQQTVWLRKIERLLTELKNYAGY